MRSDWTYAELFVLLFDAGSDAAEDQVAGRIEHVASMRSARFATLEELMRFVRITLAEEGRSRPAEDGTE